MYQVNPTTSLGSPSAMPGSDLVYPGTSGLSYPTRFSDANGFSDADVSHADVHTARKRR